MPSTATAPTKQRAARAAGTATAAAPTLDALTRDELVASHHRLEGQVAELARQLDWFRTQLFGAKSEKRIDRCPHQRVLGEAFAPPETPARPDKETITYTRGKGPKVRPGDCVTDEGLRFGPDVPVRTIRLPVPGIEGLGPDDYEIIDTKVVHRLAQRPASFVVLRYETPVVKTASLPRSIGSWTRSARSTR